MIHAYHAIFCAYGFRLPNDPRGSWSDFVGAWELFRFGPASKSIDHKEKLSPAERIWQKRAKESLLYSPVSFSGAQAREIGRGFANAVESSGFAIWACSILPEHVHLVIGRHHYRVEQIVRLLKGEATKQLREAGMDPMAGQAKPGRKIPKPWSGGRWKAFLDSEEAIENAIRYVEENPIKEGKPRQHWSFVVPFVGIDKAWVTYH